MMSRLLGDDTLAGDGEGKVRAGRATEKKRRREKRREREKAEEESIAGGRWWTAAPVHWVE
jgi:hypothetical protein